MRLYKLICRVLRYSSLLYIFPVILLAGIFNISRFYELETCLKVNKTEVLNFTSECQKVIINESFQSPCKVFICPTVMRKSLNQPRCDISKSRKNSNHNYSVLVCSIQACTCTDNQEQKLRMYLCQTKGLCLQDQVSKTRKCLRPQCVMPASL